MLGFTVYMGVFFLTGHHSHHSGFIHFGHQEVDRVFYFGGHSHRLIGGLGQAGVGQHSHEVAMGFFFGFTHGTGAFLLTGSIPLHIMFMTHLHSHAVHFTHGFTYSIHSHKGTLNKVFLHHSQLFSNGSGPIRKARFFKGDLKVKAQDFNFSGLVFIVLTFGFYPEAGTQGYIPTQGDPYAVYFVMGPGVQRFRNSTTLGRQGHIKVFDGYAADGGLG